MVVTIQRSHWANKHKPKAAVRHPFPALTTTESDRVLPLRGVYGLQVTGRAADQQIAPEHLVDAEPAWPCWDLTIELRAGPHEAAPPGPLSWSAERALVAAHPDGHIVIDRVSASTTIYLPRPPLPGAVIHPYLGSTGVVAGHWLGRTPFHAGGFLVDGKAWGVLGGRGMGKSSFLMWLHQQGLPVLTDDVLVLEQGMAYSGPRCIDLRAEAAEKFRSGEFLGTIGTRERWRVSLPPVPGATTFGGWVLLGWADQISFDRPRPPVRLSALGTHLGLAAPGAAFDGLLELVDYPMVIFARPRAWDRMDGAMDQLLDAVSATRTH
jgi:hypothetical protein